MGTGLDVINAENMTITQMNVQNAITSDSEGHESDNAALKIMATYMESDGMQDIDRYMEDTEYLNL